MIIIIIILLLCSNYFFYTVSDSGRLIVLQRECHIVFLTVFSNEDD